MTVLSLTQVNSKTFRKKLQCLSQWTICMLCLSELPLRYPFIHLKDVTTRSSSRIALIGTVLENCESLLVVNYENYFIVSESTYINFEDHKSL